MDPYEALDMFQKLSNPQFHLLLKKKKKEGKKYLLIPWPLHLDPAHPEASQVEALRLKLP